MGNVKLFELFETDLETKCKECFLYWSQGIVYCTCGHLFERKWSQPVSLRRDDLMAIDVGRLKNKETIILPIIWERDASRGFMKGFTIVSWKILNFVNLNSNMIELKKSVSRWTRSRRSISPITWRKQNTFDTERIGGFLSIILAKPDQWEIVLTSTMRWPH